MLTKTRLIDIWVDVLVLTVQNLNKFVVVSDNYIKNNDTENSDIFTEIMDIYSITDSMLANIENLDDVDLMNEEFDKIERFLHRIDATLPNIVNLYDPLNYPNEGYNKIHNIFIDSLMFSLVRELHEIKKTNL